MTSFPQVSDFASDARAAEFQALIFQLSISHNTGSPVYKIASK